MERKKKIHKKNLSNEEVERIFNVTWDNWSSRRRCESKHVPEYIKRQKHKDID